MNAFPSCLEWIPVLSLSASVQLWARGVHSREVQSMQQLRESERRRGGRSPAPSAN